MKKRILITIILSLFLLVIARENEVKHLKDQLRIDENIIHDLKLKPYQIAATLEKFVDECNQKDGVAIFPTIVVDRYDKVILKCFRVDMVKEDVASWTELEINPTFALPTN